MRHTLIILFLLFSNFYINAQNSENSRIKEHGIYYKFSSIVDYKSNDVRFSPGNSLGYIYTSKKSEKGLGFEFNLEFLDQNVYRNKSYNETLDTFAFSRTHFSCLESSFKIQTRYPFKRFAIYFNPGITIGTFQKLKSKAYYFAEGNHEPYKIDPWSSNPPYDEGFVVGLIQSIGFDFRINGKTSLSLDYTSCAKIKIPHSSDFFIILEVFV